MTPVPVSCQCPVCSPGLYPADFCCCGRCSFCKYHAEARPLKVVMRDD